MAFARIFLKLSAGAAALLWPWGALAALPLGWDGPLCGMAGFASCGGGGFGAADLASILVNRVIPIVETAFVGVAAIYFATAGLFLTISGGDTNTMTEQKKVFAHGATGLVIAGSAIAIVQTFTGPAIVNPAPFNNALSIVITAIKVIIGVTLIFIITLSGLRIILLQGNEAEVEKQKKHFINGLLGVVVVLIADPLIVGIVPAWGGGAGNVGVIITEIGGLARFALTILGGLAVAGMIAGGILYAISFGDEQKKQQAKKIVFSTAIAVIIAIASYTLVGSFT